MDVSEFPSAEDASHLAGRFALADSAVDLYRRDGHVTIRQLLDPAVLEAARPHLLAGLRRSWPVNLAPVEKRVDAYSKAFVQITNVGLRDARVRAVSHARRIGRVAARLMGVRGVRIYCEDWLLKEPGAGPTPWHQDACVFPLDAQASVTAWIPLQAVRSGMGLPRFVSGSPRLGLVPVDNISDESDAHFNRVIEELGLPVVDLGDFELGDVSFHDGLTVHGAAPNRSGALRVVLALHMFADGARIKPPTTPSMVHQLNDFARGLAPGDLAATAAWPRIYSVDEDDEEQRP